MTSSASYSVITSQTPTISSFTPTIASPGTSLTVTGSNFDPTVTNDRFYINDLLVLPSSITAGSLSTSIPSSATSGHLTIETPNGSGASTDDLFLPPPGYTPSQIQVTGQIAPGDSQTVAINTAGDDGMILFDGTQGQRVSLNLTSCTFSGVGVTIYNPRALLIKVDSGVGSRRGRTNGERRLP